MKLEKRISRACKLAAVANYVLPRAAIGTPPGTYKPLPLLPGAAVPPGYYLCVVIDQN